MKKNISYLEKYGMIIPSEINTYKITDGMKICNSGENCKHPNGCILPNNHYFFKSYGSALSNLCRYCEKFKESKLGIVYFILSEELNRVKIGFTAHKTPDKRLQDLQTSSPCKLKLITHINGDIKLEKQIHDEFYQFRITGEWFEYSDEIKEYIEKIKQPPK